MIVTQKIAIIKMVFAARNFKYIEISYNVLKSIRKKVTSIIIKFLLRI